MTRSDAVFALLAPTIAGDEIGAVAAAEADGVPMVGPSTPNTQAAPLPAGPPDLAADAVAEYRELVAEYALPRDDQLGQRRVLAAAKIIVEALRRAGRDPTGERLVDAMESLQDFRTGLIPPVSYSATRRIGTDGIWIVPLNTGSPIWWNR